MTCPAHPYLKSCSCWEDFCKTLDTPESPTTSDILVGTQIRTRDLPTSVYPEIDGSTSLGAPVEPYPMPKYAAPIANMTSSFQINTSLKTMSQYTPFITTIQHDYYPELLALDEEDLVYYPDAFALSPVDNYYPHKSMRARRKQIAKRQSHAEPPKIQRGQRRSVRRRTSIAVDLDEDISPRTVVPQRSAPSREPIKSTNGGSQHIEATEEPKYSQINANDSLSDLKERIKAIQKVSEQAINAIVASINGPARPTKRRYDTDSNEDEPPTKRHRKSVSSEDERPKKRRYEAESDEEERLTKRLRNIVPRREVLRKRTHGDNVTAVEPPTKRRRTTNAEDKEAHAQPRRVALQQHKARLTEVESEDEFSSASSFDGEFAPTPNKRKDRSVEHEQSSQNRRTSRRLTKVVKYTV